ncbi:hypothetical protein MDA_GLEAN10025023 [Myotis davidii]|uniref:Uncharacterized protein n=1 Tax=Myotis davidii TaxID=225400 RepID=L5M840_MYODS|nr:hypothetical protein MDA_GLEAN10025023 [Myotis davidii]
MTGCLVGEHPFLRQEFKQQQQLKAEAPFYLVRQLSQMLLNKFREKKEADGTSVEVPPGDTVFQDSVPDHCRLW